MKDNLKKLIFICGNCLLFFRRKKILKSDVKSVLVIMLYFRGDAVMCTPALRMLKKILPYSAIDVWVKSRAADIMSGNPNIRSVIVYDGFRTADYEEASDSGLSDKVKFVRELRKKRYDLCIDLTGKYSTALVALTGGFRYSSGINYNGFGSCYSKFIDIDTQHTAGHLSGKYNSIIRQTFGIEEPEWNDSGGNDLRGEINLNESAVAIARGRLRECGLPAGKPLVCIQPSAGWNAKEWDEGSYAELMRKFSGEFDYILIGGKSEKSRLGRIAGSAGLDTGRVMASGSLTDSAAIISVCDVFAGSDSAGLQLAGALGIPSVAIFGPTNPSFSNPPGEEHVVLYSRLSCSAPDTEQYCTRNAGKTCATIDCMRSVSPDDVVNSLRLAIRQKRNFAKT